MHYVLEVHTCFYRDMFIKIWQMINIAGGAPQGMFLVYMETTVSWISKLQKVVALSPTEAEYVVATEASKEMIWL
jgi:hypothetical protein